MPSINLTKGPDESALGYINRLGGYKDAGLIDMTWEELAEIFNRNLRQEDAGYNESTYRKKYALLKQFREESEFGVNNNCDADELKELRRELEKEKFEMSGMNIEN